MNTKHSLRSCAALGVACLLGGLSASCDVSSPLPDAEKSTALFDCFLYKGTDDLYTANPLPGEDAFYNPILPGWYSDPTVCTNGKGDYFLATSTFTYFPGVPLFHSRDLVNWKQVGHILDRESQLTNMKGQGVSGGIFAPAISYNPHNETYYMITTNVGAGNFFVKTKDPFGSWSDPIMLPETVGIDPSFFFDEDGKAYIVNNDDAPDNRPEYDGHRTIRIQEFDVETDKTVGPRKVIVNKGVHPEENPIWIEGPHLYKIGGKYYLMAAEGGTGGWHSEVIFRSDAPMGPYVAWKGNPILTQRHLDASRPNPVTCAGHADLIQAKEGDWWAVFLACRPVDGKFENLGRETFMMPVRWSEDGFPYITTGDELVPVVERREGVRRDSTVTFGNFEVCDRFDAPKLGMEWMTLRSAAEGLYSLEKVPGWLQLRCAAVTAAGRETPAFVARRQQHHRFECSTRMVFAPADTTEIAGMLLFKDETHHYVLGVQLDAQGDRRFTVRNAAGEELASRPLDADAEAVTLKIVSDGLSYAFCCTADGEHWEMLHTADARELSTAQTGGFTGTVVGLYAARYAD